MNTGKQHQMIVVHEHEDGSQEWFCPICGRRFLMRWPFNFKRTILEPGDEEAVHTGGTGSLEMGPVESEMQQFPEPESACEDFDIESLNDPYLAPFQHYLENSQF